MKTTNLILIALAGLGLALAALIFSGCDSSGDDTNCMATEGCPGTDAGMMADADPTAPDADTTPDANSDPCADYRWMADKPWDCNGNIPVTCDMELFTTGGVCSVQCHDAFWLSTDDLTISEEPPPSLIFYINETPITCYQHL